MAKRSVSSRLRSIPAQIRELAKSGFGRGIVSRTVSRLILEAMEEDKDLFAEHPRLLALIKAVQVQGPQSEGIYIEAADYFTRPNGCWEVEASCEAIATAIEAEISRIEGQPMGGEGRGGASWAARLEAADAQQTTEPTDDLPPDAMLSPATLAAKFDVPLQALQGRLKRWREKHADGWQEVTNRKPREPQYLYRLEAVRPVIEEMRSKAGG